MSNLSQQQQLEASLSKFLRNNSEKDLIEQVFQHLAVHTEFFENHKKAKSTILSSFHSGNQTYQNIADDWEVIETEIQEKKSKKEMSQKEKKVPVTPVCVLKEEPKQTPIALPYYATPKNNGGKTENYVWTQTLNEVQVCISLPPNIKAKDLFIQIRPHNVLIKVRKTGEILLKKSLLCPIDEFESYWMLEKKQNKSYDQKDVILFLQKPKEGAHYWDCAFKGDQQIDISKIVPSTADLWAQQEAQNALPHAFDKVIRQNAYSDSIIMNELARKNMINEMVMKHPEVYSKVKFN